MDGSVQPLQPQVRILPPRRNSDRRGSRRFVVDGEARSPEPEQPDPAPSDSDERPLGHASDDEVGARLDVTA
jgi:hypothetical protein